MVKRKLLPPYSPQPVARDRASIRRRKAALKREHDKRVKAARERVREKGTAERPMRGAPAAYNSLSGLVMSYTWKEIGAACGIGPAIVSDYFAGRRVPNFPRGVAIARFLDVPPERLCDYLVRIQERSRLVETAKNVASFHRDQLSPVERAELDARRRLSSDSASA